MRADTRRDRVADDWRRLLDAELRDLDIAAVKDSRRQFAPGLDIIASDPAQRLSEQPRREVAASGCHRSGGERRSNQTDGRVAVRPRNQVGKVRPRAHG